MPYINQRWLGGTLTNWVTIHQRIQYLLQLERRMDAGEFRNLPKKERLVDPARGRQAQPPYRRSEDHAQRLPDMLFIVDTNVEALAVDEANKVSVPIIGMVDTNSNPDQITYVIPSNDDAIRAVKLVVGAVADAAEEGMRIREVDGPRPAQSAAAIWPRWSSTLGRACWPSCRPSTSKMRSPKSMPDDVRGSGRGWIEADRRDLTAEA